MTFDDPRTDPVAFLAASDALQNAIVDAGSVEDLAYVYDPVAMRSSWFTYEELFGLQQNLKACPQEHYFTVTSLAADQPTRYPQSAAQVTFAVVEKTFNNDAEYASGRPGQSLTVTPTWELQRYKDPRTGKDVDGWRRTANN